MREIQAKQHPPTLNRYYKSVCYDMRNILLGMLACVLTACSGSQEPLEIGREPIGKIVDANVLFTNYNEMKKTQVKTDRMFLVVSGTPPIPLGSEAVVVTFDNGQRYLAWTGSTYMVHMQ